MSRRGSFKIIIMLKPTPMIPLHKAAAYFIGILFLSFTACHTKQAGFALIPKQKIMFAGAPEIGFNKFGFVKNRDNNDGFYYFAELFTRKKVYYYDEQGKLIDTIRIPKLMPNDDHVNFVAVKSRDTLMMTSGHDNYFYTFGKGKTYAIGDFGMLKHNGHTYVLGGMGKADFVKDVTYSPVSLYVQELMFPDTMSAQDQLRVIFKLYHDGPLLARITQLTTDHPQVQFMMDGFANRLGLDTFEGGTSKLYTTSDDAIFYHFPECDTLYKLNNTSGKVEKMANIRAAYANIVTGKIPFGGDGQATYDRDHTEKGIIHYMDYDPYRKLLYLRYYFEVPSTAKPIEKGDHRKWALLVYDDQLRKVGELPFEADSYNPMSLIATPKGLLLEKINTNKDASSNREFQFFEVAYRTL